MNTAIPLNKLVVSKENVRTVLASKEADKELLASIKSQGILQNLVVIPRGKTQHEVVAGGRRFAALQMLVESGDIEKDYPVPALVKSKDDDITEISLAENTQRADMHPADQFIAFAKLSKDGLSEPEIAGRFGVTENIVKKRLTLGKVAPELMELFRSDDLDLKQLMAFTIIEDHKRQLACYADLSSGNMIPYAIKNWLLGEAITASSGIGAFVTKERYSQRGGAISSDLFQETVYLSDADLVNDIASEMLDSAAIKMKSETSWSWVSYDLDSYNATDGMVSLYPELVDVPQKVTDEINAVVAQREALEKKVEASSADWTEEQDKQWDELSAKEDKLDTERDNKYLRYTDEQKAYSGCVITFNNDGFEKVFMGYAHKKDIPQPKTNGEDTIANIEDSPLASNNISEALRMDFSAYRRQIAQASLLKKPETAMDVLCFSLCSQLLAESYWEGRDLTSAQFSQVKCETSLEDTNKGRAFDELEAAKEKLNTEWLAIEDKAARLVAFCELTKKQKEQLVTYCVALTLSVSVKGSNSQVDQLVDLLNIDFSSYWTPTKENSFSRMAKSVIQEQFADVTSQDWKNLHDDSTKKQMVQSLEEKCAVGDGLQWLPKEF